MMNRKSEFLSNSKSSFPGSPNQTKIKGILVSNNLNSRVPSCKSSSANRDDTYEVNVVKYFTRTNLRFC